MKRSTAEQMQDHARKHPKPPGVASTYDVYFDDSGFDSASYPAVVNDTLRFTNRSSGQLTIYVVTQNGQSLTTAMLDGVSSFAVDASDTVSQVVKASGTYLVSLEPPPLTLLSNDPGGGKTATVIIST